MLLRISLILAILAGIGVIVLNQFQVRPHVQSIIDARNQFEQDANRERARANTAEKQLKETRAKLETTEKKLKDTEEQLAAANAKIEEQNGRITRLQRDLESTRSDLNDARAEVAAYRAIGVTADQVRAIVDSQKKLLATNRALEEEKKVIMRRLVAVQAELDRYTQGVEKEVPLPPGLKGHVMVVDPKWNFVVLDIGQEQGVLPNGVLMVSRNSKLVGKVKIMSVQSNRSIANIMPGWKLGEIMEGDLVLY